MRAACESIVPPIVETMLALLSQVEPEFQHRVRNNVTLAGGGALIRNLGKTLERALERVGGGKVTVTEAPGIRRLRRRTGDREGCPGQRLGSAVELSDTSQAPRQSHPSTVDRYRVRLGARGPPGRLARFRDRLTTASRDEEILAILRAGEAGLKLADGMEPGASGMPAYYYTWRVNTRV